jgi:hypothetical protein
MRIQRWLCVLPALVACAVEPEAQPGAQSEGGYVIEGELPEGTDLQALVADLPPGGFAVVGDPVTGEIATIQSTASPLARNATAEFSVSSPATCVDCGDPTCTSLERTVEIQLSHDTGVNGETYSLVPAGTNYRNLVTTPATWAANVGQTIDLSTTGTLRTCSAFSFYFEVEGPDRVFVTSTTTNGNLGGAAGADAICQTRANAANLGGTWMAWFGDPSAANPTPGARFTAAGPWARVGDLVKVADNLADLSDGTLDAAINRNEFGNAAPGTQYVWTGVLSNGTVAAETCSNWTSTAGLGRRGSVARTNAGWTQSGTANCNTLRSLYCFEQ